MNEERRAALEAAIGYSFREEALLTMALTHTSFVKGDGKKTAHNERLEFLGDAVLELLVSDHLYRRHAAMQEGDMTKTRARLVCERALFSAARELGLPDCLLLGHGEEATGGREKPSIVSDALEAVIGAVYLDGGMEAARTLVIDRIIRLLEDACVDERDQDYKTRLQEFVQKDHIGELRYALLDSEGPEHQKQFRMQVLLSGKPIGAGSGKSKQSAGQAAAKAALEQLQRTEESGE